ncbi:MAG: M28 family metallopeptidase [Actinomycetota bacterium]|nr:M28 family metallopeptidase [Actinomycetota bacterium]
MAAADTVTALTGFAERGGGTNAERRAAQWLAGEIAGARRTASVDTFWLRPEWALAQAWHVALALAGSLVSIGSPTLGGALVLAAIVFVLADAVTGVSPGRRLSPERASQNVVFPAPDLQRRVRLIVCANYDAGRMGLVYRPALRRAAAALRRGTGGRAPGWRAWLLLDAVGALVIAALRRSGDTGRSVAIAQLIVTVALILAFALLLEQASSRVGPAAGDNASGVGVALALVRALDVSPPRAVAVELVLTGAGDGSGAGLSHHLRAHPSPPGTDTVVLGLAASAHGDPCWWTSDGSLVPLRFGGRLIALAATAATGVPGARPHRGRGGSPALPARRLGLPAITLGGLDPQGLAPLSHLPDDRADAIDPAATDRVLGLALTMVDALDAELAAASSA